MTQHEQHRPMSLLDWGLLLSLSILWGGSFFFQGVAVLALPTLTIVAVRLVGAAVLLVLALRLLNIPLPRGRAVWQPLFVMGLLNNVIPFSLIVWGQGALASGLASILNGTTPLFTVLVAHFLTRDEKMTMLKLFGVAFGLTGVALMVGFDALSGLADNALAQLAILGAALSYAFASVYGRRFKNMGLSPYTTAAGQLIASATLITPVAIWFDRAWALPFPETKIILALLGLAALSTALAYGLYFRILANAGATNLVLVTFLVPASAIILGSLFLAEAFTLDHVIGLGVIGLALAMIDGRLPQRLSRRFIHPLTPKPPKAH